MSTSRSTLRNVFSSPKFRATRVFATTFLFMSTSIIFVNDHVLEVTNINGNSMAPTLSPSYNTSGRRDYVVWQKWSPTRNLQRGDVVHFPNPLTPESLAVKRVIALEGDTVVLDRRRRPLPLPGGSGGGGDSAAEKAWDAWRGRVQVPPSHVWVEGDNWRASKDSNYYGPLSKSLIDGRARWVVWPLSRWGSEPWEGFESATKVLIGEGRRGREWTVDGLPVELMEVGGERILPPLEASTTPENQKNITNTRDKCRRGRWSG